MRHEECTLSPCHQMTLRSAPLLDGSHIFKKLAIHIPITKEMGNNDNVAAIEQPPTALRLEANQDDHVGSNQSRGRIKAFSVPRQLSSLLSLSLLSLWTSSFNWYRHRHRHHHRHHRHHHHHHHHHHRHHHHHHHHHHRHHHHWRRLRRRHQNPQGHAGASGDQ